MPGKVSARAPAVSNLPHRSSTQITTSRKSIARPSTVIAEETPTTTLRANICSIFNDAQKSQAGHRKLIVRLRKIHESCIYEPGKNGLDHFDEEDFNAEIGRCTVHLMGVKKSEVVADRIVRFLGLFLRHANEKDAALVSGSDANEFTSIPETASTRLVSYILSILLQLLVSKEKTVRYRATQLVAHIVNSLDSIDDEYYHLLKMGLLKRIRDKESMVRVQAVLGLGRLAGNEDNADQDNDDSEEDDAHGLLEKLLNALQNDPSADVRRSLLLNLPLTPTTLPFLLERARDIDPATRRALYSRLLPALGDFRHLSVSMREKLLRWGLRDRDENVRKATARLFRERWIEDCTGSRAVNENADPPEPVGPDMGSLLELLERIDVVNSGVEEGIAIEAMRQFWRGRPDYQDLVQFDDLFWDRLSPEGVFLVRSFNDYCRQQDNGKFEQIVEEKLPEVTKLAFILQRYVNQLLDCLQQNHERSEVEADGDTIEQEFIVEQLLHIAKTLDYSDEVGRRRMFSLLRETLAFAELPDEITKLVVEVLRGVCGFDGAGERDFCGVVLEAVAEVHDAVIVEDAVADNGDESFHSAKSEISEVTPTKANGPQLYSSNRIPNDEEAEAKAVKEITINMKCLHIAQCMLQNVEGNLQQNMHLVTMLNNLVVPAVRSHEAPIREIGLLCLGLCCLLDKSLAGENLTLFLHCFLKGHEALQVTAIHIVADILTTHPSLILAEEVDEGLRKSIWKVFARGVKAEHTPKVQSAAIIALCKLMLTSIINNEDLLKQLVICYFDPGTKENAGAIQALTYFLPVYCHSKRANMERMANVAAEVMQTIAEMSEELEEGEDMVGLSVVGNMLVDWTDARKLVIQDEAAVGWDEAGKKEVRNINADIHLDLAISLLEQVTSHACSKEDKKALISMLGKLHITANSTGEKLRKTSARVARAIEDRIASDATSRNALNKLQVALQKAVGEAGEADKSPDETLAPVPEDDLTATEAHHVDQGSDRDIKLEPPHENESVTEAKDSLLEELLDDDEDL